MAVDRWVCAVWVCTVTVFGAALLSVPLLAQALPPDAVQDREREVIEQIGQARQAQSLRQAPSAFPAVSYSDVLAAPDDPVINLRYARELISRGNLQLAAATIERILLHHPGADEVRLLYAIILYRMDVLDAASVQFDLLAARQPTVAISAEIAVYRSLMAQRLKKTKRTASFSAGMHYDTNRNARPDGGVYLIADVERAIPGGETDDFGRFALGAAQISWDTGRQQLQKIYGAAAMLYDDQVEVDALDVRALLLQGGADYKTTVGDFLPGVNVSFLELDREKYSRDVAASFKWHRLFFNKSILGFVEARNGWRHYNNTASAPGATNQEGNYQKMTAGGRRTFSATSWANASVAFNRVNAAAFESYKGFEISANATKILPLQTFLTVSATLEKQFYEAPQRLISSRTRKDRDVLFDVTYGAPLSTIGTLIFSEGALPGALRPVILNLSVGFQSSNSNLQTYDTDNYRGQFMFTRAWDF